MSQQHSIDAQHNNQLPNSNSQQSKQYIDAPYNFVPLANQIVTPKWANLVSHDVPFQDGLSGEISFTLTAHTPLLVGEEQFSANEHQPGQVYPFKTPDGRYAIPGSSLKGMIRAVLEIATFSKMEIVDDRRYGLRDISGKYVAESYASRVRNRVLTGFLRLGDTGEPEIVPCAMTRLSHRDLEAWWKLPKPVFKKRTSVKDKYELWNRLCVDNRIVDPLSIPIAANGETVTNIGSGNILGFPVLTGQISDYTDDKQDRNGKWTRGKYRDFIFHSKRNNEAFHLHEIDHAAWRDFLFIHGDENGKIDMPWPGFWKKKFWNKQEIPVFYIRSANKLQIGLAYMPKLAGDFSIHDMIRHSSPKHLDSHLYDLANLIFGKISEQPQDTLKGRVWFEMAQVVGNPKCISQPDTILIGPNPTYFPNYIQQQTQAPDWKLSGRNPQYATYLETSEHKAPVLRGWKRYPMQPETEVKVQLLQEDQQTNRKVQVRLHTLEKGVKFSGRLHFHNLKPEELGALVWALNFGGHSTCRHGLGMGKSFGFGQVTLVLDGSEIVPNNLFNSAPNLDGCVNQFSAYMDKELGTMWSNTIQVRALLAMADPNQCDKFPGKLQHMMMSRIPDAHNPNRKIHINEFQDAKQKAFVLASYVPPLLYSSQPHSTTSIQSAKKFAIGNKSAVIIAPIGPTIWNNIALTWNKGSGEISGYKDSEKAFSNRNESNVLLADLSADAKKKLEKNKLQANLIVEPRGGKNWKIIKINPI